MKNNQQKPLKDKWIDEQINKFEQEILVLQSCIITLESQKLVNKIKQIKNEK